MAAPRTPANQRQRTWRAQAVQPEQKARRRRVFRVILPLFGICLLGVLAWVLVEWILRAPKLQLVAIRVADYGNPEVPTIPYCFEDIEALRKVLEAEGSQQASTWSDAENEGFAQLRTALSAKTSSRDNLLVYIKAHGVSINGTAYLLDVDFALSEGAAGRLSIGDVLKYVADSPARLKLVALDTGHMESDPQMGMLTNEFTHLLKQAVEGMSADSNVWVLTSNSLFERALVSHKDRRSAFAYYLAEGLNGKADGVLFEEDKEKVADRLIQLDELYHFVRGYVAQYARVTSDDQQAQTPMLLRAGTGEVAKPPHEVLLRIEKPQTNESKEEETQTVAVRGPGFIGENVGASGRRMVTAAGRGTTWPGPLGALAQTGRLALVGNQAPTNPVNEDSSKAAPIQPATAPTAQDTGQQAPNTSGKEAKTEGKEGAQAATEDAKKNAEPKAAEPARKSPATEPKDQTQKL
ncbi:MAG TPA: hypothetical protein VJ809_04950, partial [Pirellulales bacterium]|nr:hypothetical protein [Pirellulales bacterium]